MIIIHHRSSIRIFSYDHHPSSSSIRIFSYDHRPSSSSIVVFCIVEFFWTRQWALWALESVATFVLMCFMSQTSQRSPPDDSGLVRSAPGSTPPAYDHHPSVSIIGIFCYDHHPLQSSIAPSAHDQHPS